MKDFDILWKEGNFVNSKYLSAKVWKIEPEKYERRGYSVEDLKIGFVVGKKVHKSAVKRNKIKRQMREVVRLLLKSDKLNPGFMLAFTAKPGVVGAEYEEISQNTVDILKKARILR